MGILKAPADEIAGSAEKAGEQLLDRAGEGTPGVFRKILEVLADYEIAGSFRIGFQKKQ